MSFEIIAHEKEKTEDDYFRDWFSSAFPYGYGTGDKYFINILKDVFNYTSSRQNGACSYEDLEQIFGPHFAWFIINKLCELDILEYGTSPRYSWINQDKKIQRLYNFIKNNEKADLIKMIVEHDGMTECYKDFCNHTNLKDKGCLLNPFFYD